MEQSVPRYRKFLPSVTGAEASPVLSYGLALGDVLPLGILLTNRDGECRYSNIAYQKLCGWTGDELIGSHWSAVIHPKDHEKTLQHWNYAVQGRNSFMWQARMLGADGKVLWIRRNAALLSDNLPELGYVHIIEDITIDKAHEKAQNEAEQQLIEELEQARVILDSISDAVLSTTLDGRVSYMNPVAETLTGFSRKEAIGKPLSDIFNVVDANTHQPVEDPARRAIQSDCIVELAKNTVLIARDGVELAIEDSAAPIHDRFGLVTGAVIVFHDARFSRETITRMEYLAQRDALTGLYNRNAFHERFEQAQALAKRHKHQMGLLFIDLDDFKGINDLLGHDSGDTLLVEMARRLTTCVRTSDTVCRFGGDEFVVLLGEIAHPDHAVEVAAKIQEIAAVPLVINENQVALQLSIGVSVYPDNGESAEELLKKADAAMYRVKFRNR